jgi:hypothetical protein
MVNVNICKFIGMGEYRGKLGFLDFFIVLKEMPRVWSSSSSNCMSAVRGENGSSTGTMGDERLIKEDRDIIKFLCS